MTGLRLSDLLEPVMQLAYEAGLLIESELNRPDGPRGSGFKADVDVEIEVLLRQRLKHILFAILSEKKRAASYQATHLVGLLTPMMEQATSSIVGRALPFLSDCCITQRQCWAWFTPPSRLVVLTA